MSLAAPYPSYHFSSMLSDIRAYLPLSDRLATSGQPTEAQFAQIAAAGFEVVVNLLPMERGALPDEDVIVEELGMEYVNLPVQWTSPQVADVRRFFEVMDALTERRTWLHCAANMRVSAFLYLWRTLHRNEPEPPARAEMLRIWEPNVIWSRLLHDVETSRPAPTP